MGYRNLIHTRVISCTAYERQDGLVDIEGLLIDTKPLSIAIPGRGVTKPEEPIHELFLRLTVDRKHLIRDISIETRHTPFKLCSSINDGYRKLVGRTVGPGFSGWVKKTFKNVNG